MKKVTQKHWFSNIDNDQQSQNNGFTLGDFWLESICKKILLYCGTFDFLSNDDLGLEDFTLMFVTVKNHQKLSLYTKVILNDSRGGGGAF